MIRGCAGFTPRGHAAEEKTVSLNMLTTARKPKHQLIKLSNATIVVGPTSPNCPDLQEDKDYDKKSEADSDDKPLKHFMMKQTTPEIVLSQNTIAAIGNFDSENTMNRNELVISDGAATCHVSPWDDIFISGTRVPYRYTVLIGSGEKVDISSFKGSVLYAPKKGDSFVLKMQGLFLN